MFHVYIQTRDGRNLTVPVMAINKIRAVVLVRAAYLGCTVINSREKKLAKQRGLRAA
jgi:hypothetical protein